MYQPDVECILESAVITDAMAIIQSLTQAELPGTFVNLAKLILNKLVSLALRFKATRIDFVGDRYKASSIKNLERSRRVNEVRTIQYNLVGSDHQKLPKQWKKFLASGNNKEQLKASLQSSGNNVR